MSYFPDKIQACKSTKSNNSKSMMPRVMVLVLRTKFKNETEQRAITQRV